MIQGFRASHVHPWLPYGRAFGATGDAFGVTGDAFGVTGDAFGAVFVAGAWLCYHREFNANRVCSNYLG